MTTNDKKNDSPAPAAKAEMTIAERKAAIADTLAELEGTSDRNKQKGLRAKLRRLGHEGGLRAVKGATTTTKAVKGKGAPKGATTSPKRSKKVAKKGAAPVEAPIA